jgi:cytochrome c2
VSRSLILLATGLLIAAVSCGPSKSLTEQSPGERLFRARCSSCHALPKPADRRADEWPALVQRYGEKAKLGPDQIEEITEYLARSSQD